MLFFTLKWYQKVYLNHRSPFPLFQWFSSFYLWKKEEFLFKLAFYALLSPKRAKLIEIKRPFVSLITGFTGIFLKPDDHIINYYTLQNIQQYINNNTIANNKVVKNSIVSLYVKNGHFYPLNINNKLLVKVQPAKSWKDEKLNSQLT